jgi:Rieske Fe-S protein
MEEKDVNSIASAVTSALSKLNADTAAAKEKEKEEVKDKDTPSEVFKCPDCGGEIAGGIQYCQHCGCVLEWEE